MGIVFILSHAVPIPTTIKVKDLNQVGLQNNINIIMPNGEGFYLVLLVKKEDIFNGYLKISHNENIVYTSKINNILLKKAPKSRGFINEKLEFNYIAYELIPNGLHWKLFNEKNTYKISLDFTIKPHSQIILKLHWLKCYFCRLDFS